MHKWFSRSFAMRKILTLGVLAGAYMLAAPLAVQAGSHVSWSIGINVPGPVIYAPQPQVVYQPQPQVVYQTQPQVIYQPQPVYRYAPPPRVVYSYPVQTVVYPRQRHWEPVEEAGEHERCEHRGWRHHHDRDGYRSNERSWSREGYGRWNRWER
jgi:hypothetical protein